MRRLVHEHSDATLAEISAEPEAAARPTRECAHHVADRHIPGASPQKKSLHAAERDSPGVQKACQESHHGIASLDCQRLQIVDESGVNLAMTRRYARAPTGERIIGSVPTNYGELVTMREAWGVPGLQAVMRGGGATDAVFRANVKRVLGRRWPR